MPPDGVLFPVTVLLLFVGICGLACCLAAAWVSARRNRKPRQSIAVEAKKLIDDIDLGLVRGKPKRGGPAQTRKPAPPTSPRAQKLLDAIVDDPSELRDGDETKDRPGRVRDDLSHHRKTAAAMSLPDNNDPGSPGGGGDANRGGPKRKRDPGRGQEPPEDGPKTDDSDPNEEKLPDDL